MVIKNCTVAKYIILQARSLIANEAYIVKSPSHNGNSIKPNCLIFSEEVLQIEYTFNF